MMVIRYCGAMLATLALVACNASAPGDAVAQGTVADKPAASPAGLDLVPLTITSGGKTHAFTVEMARTSQQQAKGLMFRTELAPDMGMLFPFPRPKPASFWMKNTVIALDLLFVRSDGTIESIAANAEPYSLDPISSGEPVAAVLELAGGRAAELGLKPGDTVTWRDRG
ncbi:DUF192 domain-containing protein [Sphingomonas sp. 35-24ZXX]|uniref:DUF192 domain-containing protein n=1 Tax=Sphingomonas sp. 35-24ZXX TaxID=1545915 RepID=UPI00053BEE6C|nr:DUF192 domain-containing protein [Sphingomonas sp. 35-24ZXX]